MQTNYTAVGKDMQGDLRAEHIQSIQMLPQIRMQDPRASISVSISHHQLSDRIKTYALVFQFITSDGKRVQGERLSEKVATGKEKTSDKHEA